MLIIRYQVENIRHFLDDHWAVRLLGVPIAFLATLIALYGIFSGQTSAETGTIVLAYLSISVGVVILSLGLEKVLRAVLKVLQ